MARRFWATVEGIRFGVYNLYIYIAQGFKLCGVCVVKYSNFESRRPEFTVLAVVSIKVDVLFSDSTIGEGSLTVVTV